MASFMNRIDLGNGATKIAVFDEKERAVTVEVFTKTLSVFASAPDCDMLWAEVQLLGNEYSRYPGDPQWSVHIFAKGEGSIARTIVSEDTLLNALAEATVFLGKIWNSWNR